MADLFSNIDGIQFLQYNAYFFPKICGSSIDAKEGSSSIVKPLVHLIKEDP